MGNDGQGQSPMVMAIYNDGTRKYEAHNDGKNQALGQCFAPDLRNRSKPSHLKIVYKNNVLSVEIALELTSDGTPVFHPCFNFAINLGIDKFFGVTAATGHPISRPNLPQNADNHDIIEIRTKDLSLEGTTEEDLQSRRDSYRKEVEEEHKYMPNHRDVSTTEFKHQTIALLNQITSGLQILELSQTTVDTQLASNNNDKMTKDSMESMKSQSETQAANQIQQQLEQLQQVLERLAKTSRDNQGSQDQNKNEDVSAQQQNDWKSSYNQLSQEVKALRAVVGRVIPENEGGRGALGGQDTVVTQVKEVISSSLSTMSKRGNGAPFQIAIDAINDFLGQANAITEAAAMQTGGGGGGGGMTWTQFLLVLVLSAEVVAILVLQIKSTRDNKWSHKRV